LEKLKKNPEGKNFGVLKLWWACDEEKDIFLDIACFYGGHDIDMNTVKQILDSCGFSATIGMRVLIDCGLISILKGEIVMHDLILKMGGSWKTKSIMDVYHVL
jgi:hypothetical protein